MVSLPQLATAGNTQIRRTVGAIGLKGSLKTSTAVGMNNTANFTEARALQKHNSHAIESLSPRSLRKSAGGYKSPNFERTAEKSQHSQKGSPMGRSKHSKINKDSACEIQYENRLPSPDETRAQRGLANQIHLFDDAAATA